MPNVELGPPIPLANLARANGHTKAQLFKLAKAGKFPGAVKIGAVWYYDPVRHLLESENAPRLRHDPKDKDTDRCQIQSPGSSGLPGKSVIKDLQYGG